MFTADDLIYEYTRQQAVEDGVLVDVSEMGYEAGFKWPVAVTCDLWSIIEAIPPRLQGIQDIEGRLWDVLYMAHTAIKRSAEGGTVLYYQLHLDRIENGSRKKLITLKLATGPMGFTDPRPCVAIMLQHED